MLRLRSLCQWSYRESSTCKDAVYDRLMTKLSNLDTPIMSDIEAQAREKIQRWMHDVMLQNNWTPNEWAKRAGTAATNITRFLKGHPHIPTAKTLAKLGAVAYSQPPMASEQPVVLRNIKIASKEAMMKWRELGGRALKQDVVGEETVATTISAGVDVFAFRICDDSMNMAGIMPGDVVVVAPGKPVADKICLASVGEDVGCYLFKNGLLIPKSSNPRFEPIVVTPAVTIIGLVRQVIREL